MYDRIKICKNSGYALVVKYLPYVTIPLENEIVWIFMLFQQKRLEKLLTDMYFFENYASNGDTVADVRLVIRQSTFYRQN